MKIFDNSKIGRYAIDVFEGEGGMIALATVKIHEDSKFRPEAQIFLEGQGILIPLEAIDFACEALRKMKEILIASREEESEG